MGPLAWAALYAVLLWWFSTGVILLLDHAPRRTHRWSMAGATLLAAGALAAIGAGAGDASAAGAYTAFTAALVVWGWQEMAYYMGFLSGPRPAACPPALRGADRFRAALATSLWHECAIVIGGVAILALVWGGPNRLALWTYAILALMNLSARLNLFLGVRNLHAEFLPEHLGYLAGYLTRRAMNPLFPVSVALGTGAAVLLGGLAWADGAPAHEQVGFAALATLMALATLEHGFLMLPLPAAALWRWSLPAAADASGAGAGAGAGDRAGRPHDPGRGAGARPPVRERPECV